MDTELISKYGFGFICFVLFLVLFWRQNKTLEVDRDMLIKRILALEDAERINHQFIKTKLSSIIEQQTKVIVQNNEALLQHSKDYARLCDIIGKINRRD